MIIEYKNKRLIFISDEGKATVEVLPNTCISLNNEVERKGNLLENIRADYEAWFEYIGLSFAMIKVGGKKKHYYLLTIGDILSNDKSYHKIIMATCKNSREIKDIEAEDENTIEGLVRIHFAKVYNENSKYRCFEFKEIKPINSLCNNSKYKEIYF